MNGARRSEDIAKSGKSGGEWTITDIERGHTIGMYQLESQEGTLHLEETDPRFLSLCCRLQAVFRVLVSPGDH